MSYQDEASINSTMAVVNQSVRRVLEGYDFTITGAAIGQNNVSGNHSVSITWYRDGVAVGEGPSLTIEKATENDSGVYTFSATNAFGTVNSDGVEIQIVHPPDDTSK